MRWLKFILYAVSALLLLAIVSTVVVIIVFDDEKIRDTLISTVEESSDARLSIAGDFSVRLSINPTVSVTDLAFRSASDGYDVEAGELTVQISLLSLISGPVKIKELRLNNVKATYQYGGKTKVVADAAVKSADLEELLPYIDRIGIGNLSLGLINQETGSARYISVDKLDLARTNKNRFLVLRGTGEMAGRVFKLSGKLGMLRDIGVSMSPFPLELQITGKEYNLAIEGVIENPLQGLGVDLTVVGNVKELADLIDYNRTRSVSLGQVKGSLRVKGDVPDIRLEEVKLSLNRGDDINLELQNDIINPDTWGKSGLQVKGYINDPQVFNWLLPIKLPSFQKTVMSATFFQKAQQYTIEDIHIQATAMDVAEAELKGRIVLGGDSETGLVSNMNLALRFSTITTETIKPFVFDELPEIGPTSGSLHLLVKSGVMSVTNLDIKVGSEKTLFANATGQISGILIKGKPASQAVDLKLTARANSTSQLESVVKLSLPEVRDIRFEGHLTGSSDELILNRIDLVAGQLKKLKIKAQGTIRLGDKTENPGEQAINLDVQLSTSASQSLSAWTGEQVPALGPVKANMHVSGSFDHVEIHKARVEVGNKKDFKLVARGKIGAVDLKQGASLQSTDMQLQLFASSLQALPGTTNYKLPALGKVSGSAHITGQGSSYRLGKIKLFTGDRKNSTLRLNGSILDALAFSGIKLQLNVDANMYDLLATYFKPEIRDLGRVKGKLRLSDKNGPLGIQDMNVTAEKNQAYSLKISGGIGNILYRDERDANIDLSVQNWAFVEKLLNKPLPVFAPMHAKGRVFSKKNVSRFDGEATIGKTQIITRLSIDYTGKTPRLTGSIVSPEVNLSDIGVAPKSVADTTAKKADAEDKRGHIFTTDPFSLSILGKINGELQIKADKIRGANLSYSSLDTKIALNDGKLRMFPARFVVEKGVVDADFSVDTSKSPVGYKLHIEANDVNLKVVTSQFQREPVAVKGNMNVVVDLAANGDSARALASSLDGKIHLMGENIYVLRSYVELLMRDVLSWTMSSFGLREKYVLTHCEIIDLTAKQGLITSDLILLDGPSINLMSELKLNLRDETIDMVINPEKKNTIFSNVSPVRLKGPLRDYDVVALSAGEVASSYGGLLYVPQVVVSLKALSFLRRGITGDDPDKQSPCLDINKTSDAVK